MANIFHPDFSDFVALLNEHNVEYLIVVVSIKMRIIAEVKKINSPIKRLMIYESNEGVYLFGFDTIEDSHSNWDEWYETIDEAKEECNDRYGIEFTNWTEIPDPMEDCQHDWINPVRVKGRNMGTLDWTTFEKLNCGKWIEL